jgi:hypothetical protein
MANEVQQGLYGRWSGHTHPPGYSLKPSDIDRANIPFKQTRSGIWGDEGTKYFYRDEMAEIIARTSERQQKWRSFFGAPLD